MVLNASKVFNTKYRTIPKQKAPHSTFCGTIRLSFCFVRLLSYRMDVKKSKGPPFTFFGTTMLFKILIFRLILGFLNMYNFFQYPKFRRKIRSNALYPNIWRYIRTILRFTMNLRRQRFKNKRSHFSQHAISELLKQFPSTKVTLCVSKQFFFEKRIEHILKTLRF